MPVVTLTLIEGYDEETRQTLCTRLTDAVQGVIAAPTDGVTVIVHEVAAANYMRGRVSRKPGAPLKAPSQVVRDFLAAMEARDLARARGFLADGFAMTFPGGATFTRLEDLVAWAAPRYARVAKTYERFDEAIAEDGACVYCFGTLHGTWLDGVAFEGIRFIDRFTVQGGKLIDQRVWNDMAEVAADRLVAGRAGHP